MNIGKNIKKIREMKKISQDQLANNSGIPRTSLGRYERGERTPNVDVVAKIANALEVDIDLLINGLSYEIYDRSDVFKLYNQLNTKTRLSNFLGFRDDFEMDFEMFKAGHVGDYNLYDKVANFLGLSEDELYKWYLSDTLYELIGLDDFGVSDLSKDDLKYIFDNNLLEKQTFDSLNTEGLSINNQNILKNYFNNRTKIKIDKMKSQKNYNPMGRSRNSSPISIPNNFTGTIENTESQNLEELLENETTMEMFKEKLDEIKQLKPLLAHHGLNFSINKDTSINISIPKYDIFADLELDIFLDFINKVSWGIDREIDCLKRDFFDID